MYTNFRVEFDKELVKVIPDTIDYSADPRDESKLYKVISNQNYKIAVVSLHIGEADYVKLTKNNLEIYCKKHNYDLYYFNDIVNESQTVMWQKQNAVKKILDLNQHDAVVWIDSDIVITDMDKPLKDFINIDPSKDIYLSRDIPMNLAYRFYIGSGLLPYINSGIFIVKNSSVGREFMNDVLAGYDRYNRYFAYNRFHEQSIMQHLYFEKYNSYTLVLPHTMMQTLYSYGFQPGDFAIHFAGMPELVRNYMVRNYTRK